MCNTYVVAVVRVGIAEGAVDLLNAVIPEGADKATKIKQKNFC